MWLDSKAVNCPQKWGNFKHNELPHPVESPHSLVLPGPGDRHEETKVIVQAPHIDQALPLDPLRLSCDVRHQAVESCDDHHKLHRTVLRLTSCLLMGNLRICCNSFIQREIRGLWRILEVKIQIHRKSSSHDPFSLSFCF